MTEPPNALAENFVFFLKKDVSLVQDPFFILEPFDMYDAALPKNGKKHPRYQQSRQGRKDPALAEFTQRHAQDEVNIAYFPPLGFFPIGQGGIR